MKIYIYYRTQLIKIKKVKEVDLLNDIYKVRVWGKKHLFGTNFPVTLLMKPIKLKIANDKEMHIECIEYEGVDIK